MVHIDKKTLVVNLFGGPGVGKSTIAANIFAKLKWAKIDSELVSEYAKHLIWEQSFPKMKNQIYIFAKQHNKQWILDGKVDVMITDSPLPTGLIYDAGTTKGLKELIMSEFNNFNNLNIYLKREKDYNPNGRNQTEAEAKEVDLLFKSFLIDNNIPHIDIAATEENVDLIISIIKKNIS